MLRAHAVIGAGCCRGRIGPRLGGPCAQRAPGLVSTGEAVESKFVTDGIGRTDIC